MSGYSMMEEGATKNQKRSDTGPVTLYQRGYFSTHRALNRTESLQILGRIDMEYSERLEKVHHMMSRKYLAFMRAQLQGFNLSNHQIFIRAGMGISFLEAVSHNGETAVADMRSTLPVVQRLQEIDQLLEGKWDWAHYLDGKSLNPPKKANP